MRLVWKQETLPTPDERNRYADEMMQIQKKNESYELVEIQAAVVLD